ncbi:MAG TPA: tyrosine-type recombinase/integrase [Pirellulaceae bacterium]
MADSTKRIAARKPAFRGRSDWRIALGLHLDYPLFLHQSGRWAKKVRGKLHYFGKTADDPKGERALLAWLDQKDELLAGRTPRTKGEGLTVRELCDRFLQAKDQQLDSGDISPLTRTDYERTTARIVAQFGKNRLVADLASEDFEALRATIAKTCGPVALGNEIQRVRVVFKYGYDAALFDQPMRYGPLFKRPSKKVLRLAKAAKGPRLFEATDIRRMIESADVQLKAMVLLAMNCGFGNSDCGTLPLASIQLRDGWLNHHRSKTGVNRRCSLWPETIEALKIAIANRPAVKMPEAEPLVFVTRYGAPWAKESFDNPITKEFRKLLDDLKLHKPGLGFYTLRHVFRTVADEARDQPAINSIMGHSDPSMAGVYRERIGDDRLQAVTDHVRAWLFPREAQKAPSKPSEKPSAKRALKPRRERAPGTNGELGERRQLRVVG